jgi:hypothetical protein
MITDIECLKCEAFNQKIMTQNEKNQGEHLRCLPLVYLQNVNSTKNSIHVIPRAFTLITSNYQRQKFIFRLNLMSIPSDLHDKFVAITSLDCADQGSFCKT